VEDRGSIAAVEAELPARSNASPRQLLVPRQRLTDRLSGTQGVRVTTIVAPAGYGKSALIDEWRRTAHARARRFHRLALEPGDNDPMLFWTGFLSAAQGLGANAEPAFEAVLREELRQARRAPPRTFLASLLAALEEVPQRGILVLDDLHLIQAPAIREGLAFVAERLPPTVHIVLVSRATITDLPLHRVRARDELQELTAADLAFTAAEGAELLRAAVGVELEADAAAELVSRTEGWVTGLKLAAAAIRETEDPNRYVGEFAGRNRDIAAFLLSEVLDRQPPELRRFLLETSILETLDAEACDAVTGGEDSVSQLRLLESGGIFLVALDDNRYRYRYQALFAEFLRAELEAQSSRRVVELHRNASDWYERAGESDVAVGHAIRAGEHERAAALISGLVAEHHRRGLDGTLQGWFAALPEEVIGSRPELAIKRAWMHSYSRTPLDALRWCERADRGAGDRVDVLVESSCLRAHTYRMLGDIDAALQWGRRAIELLEPRDACFRYVDAYPRLAMTDAVAEAYVLKGDPEAAIELLEDGLRRTREGGNEFAAVSIPGQLAAISSGISRFAEAEEYATQAGAAAERFGLEGQPPIAESRVALGEVNWERDDLTEAERQFLAAIDATRRSRRLWIRARALLGVARCRLSRRSPDEAFAILSTVEDLYPWGSPPSFLAAQVAESQVRFGAAVGDAEAARDWLGRLASTAPGLIEDGYLEALVTLAEGRGDEALALASRIGEYPPELVAKAVEREVLRARAAGAVGDRVLALEALAGAVEIAEPRRFVRTLVEPAAILLGSSIRALAAGVGEHRAPAPDYVRDLDRAARAEQGRVVSGIGRDVREPLDEPLSEAELAVIRLLPGDYTYAEIAARRYVSVNTVKSQLKSIYRKLGVASRITAIERSRELGLLSD
jgi:LuxR family transcriptional regulator, maltose regulon positive regulatory protein